ncbi:TetR/AcrR family transcriptional regulator [Streptomyces sp. NPDC051840]|uniref:TetR/AcrR family transcriptional regulator n=1 Tax=Streptomyces sp. NPDC051840 TaxID=3154752 RepID=UPI00342984DF
MVKQDRALRTRAALVRAAASEFDLNGYDGTSLSAISKTAGISMGALTFHFASKAAIAEAVQEEGRGLSRVVLDEATSGPGPALETVVNVTVGLIRLCEQEVVVRSAMRLARERPVENTWSDIWVPIVRLLLEEAENQGQLQDGARPSDITALAEILTSGAEAYLRSRFASKSEADSVAAQLKTSWQLVLSGITAKEHVPAALRVPEASPTDGPAVRSQEEDGLARN